MAPSIPAEHGGIDDPEDSYNQEDDYGEDEYGVDDILGERANPDNPGQMQYLIKWLNYDLHHCTWEPAEHLGPGLLEQWQQAKDEIEAGEREPYDIELYHAACRKHEEQMRKEEEKRNEPPLIQDDHLDNEAKETRDVNPATIPPVTKPKEPVKQKVRPKTLPEKPRLEVNGGRITKEKSKQKRTPILPPKPLQRLKEEKRASLGKGKASATTTGYQGTARGPNTNTSPTTSKTPTSNTFPQEPSTLTPKAPSSNMLPKKPSGSAPKAPLTQPTRSSTSLATKFRGGKRLTATRTNPLPSETPTRTSNVFVGGKERKKRVGLGDAMDDPAKAPKPFSNMHVMNIARKRGNERNDAAPPAFDSIPSSFILNNDRNSRASIDRTKTNTSSAPSELPPLTESPMAISPSDTTPGVPTLKSKKSVRFTEARDDVPEDEPMGEGIDDIFGETATMDLPSTNSGSVDESLPRRLSLATYQESRQTQVVAKTVAFGKTDSDFIRVLFSGIVRQSNPWLNAFIAQDTLNFSSVCSSSNFISHKASLVAEVLSAGAIEYTSGEILSCLRNVAEHLQRCSFASHLVTEQFSILVYPSKCDDWNGLNMEKVDTESPLLYLIYRSPIDTRLYPPASVPRAPARLADIQGGSHCELLMKHLFELDFTQFLPQNPKDKDKQVYMLIFHPKQEQVCRAVKLWLRSGHPNCRIFSHEIEGSWGKFHETVRAGAAGTIILHEDVTNYIGHIPRIYQMVSDNRSYTFWNLTTGQYNPPKFPSEAFVTVEPGTLQMTRLFPHGRAFLITPSFALSDPIRLCQFLEWFKDYCCNPHYLIMACADFPGYLKAVILEKSKEHEDMLSSQANNPKLEQLIADAGLSKPELDARFNAWKIMKEITDEFGSDAIDEEMRKVHWITDYVDVNDEQCLVNWFCRWSTTKLDRYRKFTVLGSSNSRNNAAYRRIKIPFYTDSTVSDPDLGYLRELQISQETQAGRAAKWAKEHPQGATAIPDLKTHSAAKLRNWIGSFQEYCKRRPNWARLHAKPVSWLDVAMADHFGDPRIEYDTFNNWLSGVLSFPGANTWYGLFYTIDKPWNPQVPANTYGRHPWVAVIRPSNPHFSAASYNKMQLFIWDISAQDRERTHGHAALLLDMQKRLVNIIKEQLPVKFPRLQLDEVYVSSETKLEAKPGDDLVDLTRKRVEEMMADGKVWLPPFDNLLPGKGWTLLASSEWKHGMTVGSSEVPEALKQCKPPRKPHNTSGRIPSSILHATRSRVKVGKSKCVNHLFEAAQMALTRDESSQWMRYQYKSTLDWYHDVKTEGRDMSHVQVDSADRIIAKLLHKKQPQT
ncbi:hypothetical protein F5Y04DRAFT_182922 [Hypomontagnella monticulosa]|nr:hypothetical protein F5Y04DRAFT_182922 [Hypomontagnella monticulosa]